LSDTLFDLLQLGVDIGGALIAPGFVLLQALQDDGAQVGRDPRIKLPGVFWRLPLCFMAMLSAVSP